MRKFLHMAVVLPLFILCGCFARTRADLLIYNAKIYTVDSSFKIAEAMVIGQGKILAVGSKKDLEAVYEPLETEDAHGKFIYPGFIDAHCHFYDYCLSLGMANLTGTKSWDEILERLTTFSNEHPDGWLIGGGWDQNDWSTKEFPTRDSLDKLFPGRPIFLTRIDGHAALASKAALDIAGVQPGTHLEGGELITAKGQLTGLLVDNAVGLVQKYIPDVGAAATQHFMMEGQQNCFAKGLTTVDDCGLPATTIRFMDSLQKKGELKMRIYAMLGDNIDNLIFAMARGIIKTDRMNVRAFKLYADGALGSRGACLVKDYADRKGWPGFLLSPVSHFDSVANWMYSHGFQTCTHAIGDSANRTILDVYSKYLQPGNDLRWRIEHAQIVAPEDIDKFGKYNIIPSVQPTHATSDMYWAGDRLGSDRLKTAYAYHDLLEQNGWIPLGTDFPVEDISPLKTFYAAVVRKDASGYPAEGFQMENALSREHTLRGITIWAARANFEDAEKGSLEKGKWADFTILDKDLMTTTADSLLGVNVLQTFIAGEKVFGQ